MEKKCVSGNGILLNLCNCVVPDVCVSVSDMACSVAGITSDANVLTNQLRLFSQRHLLHYGEPIPCEQLVASLCDIKQAYTQFGGVWFRKTSYVYVRLVTDILGRIT